ncbi:MAG: TetR/AcrR family transcriptional regulator [Polyangiaceae bacterium]
MSSAPSKAAPTAKRRSDGERRRDAILDAALRCFNERGVLAVGIEDIRREAGASPSSVYNLFADLGEIIVALLIRVFDALFAHLAARVGRTRTAEGAVKALVDAHLEWIAEHPKEGAFMYQAMTLAPRSAGPGGGALERLTAAKARALAPVVAHLGVFVERGEIPDWSPQLLDVVILGVAHEALRRWLSGATELDPKKLRKSLPAIAWRSIRR